MGLIRLISACMMCMGLLLSNGVFAQQNSTFYNMSTVDQSNRLNPSSMPDSKLNIGLPVLSNLYLNFSNSGFTASDVLRNDGDSLVIDLNNMLDAMHKKNHLSLALEADILSVGKRIGKRNYLSFNASLRSNLNITYDKGPFELLINGNGPYVGQSKDVSVEVNSSMYLEYGIGFARTLLKDKLTVGGRFKLLSGLVNASSKKSDVTLYTDPVSYDITLQSDIEYNVAGNLENDSTSVSDYILSQNRGMALDLGASYKWSDKLEFSASVLDIGYINWKDNATNYKSKNPGGSVTFSGIDLNDYINDSSSLEEGFESFMDSLQNELELEETNNSYRNALPTQIYIGANYYLNPRTNIGVLVYTQIYKGNVLPGFTASFNKKFGKIAALYGSLTYYNKSIANVGMGFSANLGPVQLYAVTDNVIAIIDYTKATNAVMRVGLNLRFGNVNGPSRKERKLQRKSTKKGTVKEVGNASF